MIYRCNNRIMHKDGRIQDFNSINAAKRESHDLQTKGLGRGQVSVVTKFPKKENENVQDSSTAH